MNCPGATEKPTASDARRSGRRLAALPFAAARIIRDLPNSGSALAEIETGLSAHLAEIIQSRRVGLVASQRPFLGTVNDVPDCVVALSRNEVLEAGRRQEQAARQRIVSLLKLLPENKRSGLLTMSLLPDSTLNAKAKAALVSELVRAAQD